MRRHAKKLRDVALSQFADTTASTVRAQGKDSIAELVSLRDVLQSLGIAVRHEALGAIVTHATADADGDA